MTLSRRNFLKQSGGAAAGLMAPFAFKSSPPQTPPSGNSFLIKNGTIITMDDELGDFEPGDILIEDGVITEIGESLSADSNAEIIDAEHKIVIPGFVDTHRHMWQGALRNILPAGELSDYMEIVTGRARDIFRPKDAEIGNLLTAFSAIDSGVTTVLDWSHIGNSPAHTDAAISGLRESEIRAVYAYGAGADTPERRFPEDLRRLRNEHFSDNDSLLTLALAAGINAEQWELARDVGARISVHVNGTGDLIPIADDLGPDVTCIHCCNLNDREWRLLAENSVGISISAPVEMIMGHGIPPIMQTLEYGITPSLSVDVETTVPSNMFTQMRSIYTLQRMQVLNPEISRTDNPPELLTPKEVLEFATVNGALHNGLNDRIGSLTPGKAADLVMLSKNDINITPVNNIYGSVVMGMDRGNVDTVMINGDIKKWKGELVYPNMDELYELAVESNRYILTEAGLNKG